MAEYFFSVLGENQSLKGGKRTAAKRNRIAIKVGGSECGYTYYRDNAQKRWRGWGYCANRGNPFDQATAKSITDAWEQSGVGESSVK